MAEPLKIVAKYPTAKDARRARYRLEQAGIPSHLEAEPTAGHTWYEMGLPRGFYLLVEESRAAEAVPILKEMEAAAAAPPVASDQPPAEPWTCAACQTPVAAGEPVCPQCGGPREESEQLDAKAAKRSEQAVPPEEKPLPWFTGFLLLFPPALVVYLLYKLISQAGRTPAEDEQCAEQQESSPPNGEA